MTCFAFPWVPGTPVFTWANARERRKALVSGKETAWNVAKGRVRSGKGMVEYTPN